MSYIAKRLRSLPPYLFAHIDAVKQEALDQGVDLIDLGVGDPDLSPPAKVVASLIKSVQETDAHHYSSYSGIAELRKTFSIWFQRHYESVLDQATEVLPLIGSKEGIGHIFLSNVDQDDEVLVPNPGYPVYSAGAVLAGAKPIYFPLRKENGFLPDIDDVKKLVSPRTRIMWLNYPSNPTTAMADETIFREIVEFAERYGVVVCHDTAYSELVFDGKKSVSFLQVPGAKDVGIEFHSLSKTFCMPGWRVGFAVGNADVIGGLSQVKTNLDSGIFIPVQKAAVTALADCEEEANVLCSIFESRRNRFVNGLRDMGWNVPMPSATFYVWAPVPDGYDAMNFCTLLLKNAGIVCTPGTGFGSNGEGFVRMSLTVSDDRLDVALERLEGLEIDWS